MELESWGLDSGTGALVQLGLSCNCPSKIRMVRAIRTKPVGRIYGLVSSSKFGVTNRAERKSSPRATAMVAPPTPAPHTGVRIPRRGPFVCNPGRLKAVHRTRRRRRNQVDLCGIRPRGMRKIAREMGVGGGGVCFTKKGRPGCPGRQGNGEIKPTSGVEPLTYALRMRFLLITTTAYS